MGGHDNYPRVEEGFAVGLRGVGNKSMPWDRERRTRDALITHSWEALLVRGALRTSAEIPPGLAWPRLV